MFHELNEIIKIFIGYRIILMRFYGEIQNFAVKEIGVIWDLSILKKNLFYEQI